MKHRIHPLRLALCLVLLLSTLALGAGAVGCTTRAELCNTNCLALDNTRSSARSTQNWSHHSSTQTHHQQRTATHHHGHHG